MKISQNKITLYGDKVAWDLTGQLASLAQSKDTWAGLISTVVVEKTFHIHEASLIVLGMNFGLSAFIRGLEKATLHLVLNRAKIDDLCINTKPDAKQPSNLDQWGQPAARMMTAYALGMTAWVAGAFAADRTLGTGALYIYPMASTFIRLGLGYNRWHMVSKDAFRVEEDKGPPEEPVRRTPTPLIPPLQPAGV
jgi:hypothetical protein